MMLNLYVESQLMRRDLESWLAKQRERMLAEDGMSETIQNVLWAIFAIAIVGIVAAIIQAYVVGKDLRELSLYIAPMTDDEKKIVKAGCLINYNRNR